MLDISAWHARSPRTRAVACLWMLVLLAAVVEAGRHAWVTDDIFITFRYCDNVLAGLGPVYNAGERSEGYTHFLWFALFTVARALHLEPTWLARYAALPAYLGCLVWLVRISARLFPGRGGIWGIPVAMLAWALHEDARWFASGGLETAAFTWALLVGFEATALPREPRSGARAGWAFALAVLLRPEGLVYSALAAGFLAWCNRRELRSYAVTWILLVAPLFAFRLLYYGYPLPNPYYAKSGSLVHWPQGWAYTRLYFGIYSGLLLAVLGLVPIARRWRAVRWATSAAAAADPSAEAPRALLLAFVAAAVTVLAVTRAGGDFMFARFFLPTTPFLLLLVEAAVHELPRWWARAGAALVFAGLMIYGGIRKHGVFDDKRNIRGIVDEPQFYPEFRLREIREAAKPLRECLARTKATLVVGGGQAALAYYARFPVAIERFGLTDETIAHQPIRVRGRPGHEKLASADYLYQRKVNFRFHFQPLRSVPQYTLLEVGGVAGDILIYDRALMEHLKTCRGARFLEFPRWLTDRYLPTIASVPRPRLVADWNQFQHFYFNHNPDPEGLRERLRAALAAQGLVNLPDKAPPFVAQDPGLLRDQ